MSSCPRPSAPGLRPDLPAPMAGWNALDGRHRHRGRRDPHRGRRSRRQRGDPLPGRSRARVRGDLRGRGLPDRRVRLRAGGPAEPWALFSTGNTHEHALRPDERRGHPGRLPDPRHAGSATRTATASSGTRARSALHRRPAPAHAERDPLAGSLRAVLSNYTLRRSDPHRRLAPHEPVHLALHARARASSTPASRSSGTRLSWTGDTPPRNGRRHVRALGQQSPPRTAPGRRRRPSPCRAAPTPASAATRSTGPCSRTTDPARTPVLRDVTLGTRLRADHTLTVTPPLHGTITAAPGSPAARAAAPAPGPTTTAPRHAERDPGHRVQLHGLVRCLHRQRRVPADDRRRQGGGRELHAEHPHPDGDGPVARDDHLAPTPSSTAAPAAAPAPGPTTTGPPSP